VKSERLAGLFDRAADQGYDIQEAIPPSTKN
jgi:hypothetical protein